MTNSEIISDAVSKFYEEYSKLGVMNADDKIRTANEIAIRTVLEVLLNQ